MKPFMKKRIAILLAAALIAGLFPLQTSAVGRASGYGVSNPRTADGVTTWDCVWFGNYWQDDTIEDGSVNKNDEKIQIKWRVLSVNGKDAFLMADRNLDVQRYHDISADVTWETCTMRSWLNGYGASENICGIDYSSGNFLEYAFTAEEQSAIETTAVENADNPVYHTEGGNRTSDKVYLLSIDEAVNPSYGFTTSTGSITDTRQAVNTAYVAAGGEIKNRRMGSAGNVDLWWLRSPGSHNGYASYVAPQGELYMDGTYAENIDLAVRPVLHLDLSVSSVWSDAGTVLSFGSAEATPEPTETPAHGGDMTPEPIVTPVPAETGTPAPEEDTTPEPIVTPAPAQTQNPQTSSNPGQSIVPQQTAPSVTGKPGTKTMAKVKGLSVKSKKKKLAVTWKKVTGARGYQIYYSTSKKFKKKKQRTVKKNKVTLKKLKTGRTYYVKVRAYTVDGNRKVYGKWSKVVKKKGLY